MRKLIIALATCAALAGSPALADGPAWEFTAAGNSFSNGSWDFANSFTVLKAVTVSGLGYYADPNTGNVDGNPVALYSCDSAGCGTTGTLLAQATVDNTYALQGHFRYVTIPTLTLLPGDYLISAVSNSDNYTWNDVGFAVDPNLTLNDIRWYETTAGASPTFNTTVQNDQDDGYWGANLFLGLPTFTGGVPEPATWMMMILGFGSIGLALRRRPRKLPVLA